MLNPCVSKFFHHIFLQFYRTLIFILMLNLCVSKFFHHTFLKFGNVVEFGFSFLSSTHGNVSKFFHHTFLGFTKGFFPLLFSTHMFMHFVTSVCCKLVFHIDTLEITLNFKCKIFLMVLSHFLQTLFLHPWIQASLCSLVPTKVRLMLLLMLIFMHLLVGLLFQLIQELILSTTLFMKMIKICKYKKQMKFK